MITLNRFITLLQELRDREGAGEYPVYFTGAYGASEPLEDDSLETVTRQHKFDTNATIPRVDIATGIMTG